MEVLSDQVTFPALLAKETVAVVSEPIAKKPRVAPSLQMTWEKEVLQIALEGDFSRLKMATGNSHLSTGLVGQLAILGSHGKRVDSEATNFALGFVDSMQPTDAAEVALLAQMAVTHQALMAFARRLNHVETIPQQDAAERAFNKLARSYAAQMDTLKRYRSSGQQVVRVERVTVHEGGQAIVGSVAHGGRVVDEK